MVDVPQGVEPVPPVPPAPAVPPGPASARVLRDIGCPACGGSLDVAEGRTVVTCRYCATNLAALGEPGVARFMVLDRVPAEAAEATVRAWLARGWRKDSALGREAELTERFLAFFPFVRARCDVVGWVLGRERQRRRRGNRTEWVEVPRELQVERHVDRTAPAAEMAEFGVGRVNLAGDELRELDEEALRRRGMVFRPQRAAGEVADAGLAAAMDEVRASVRLDRVTYSWLARVREATSVVFYPLWVVRYTFRGRGYQVLVDAEDGSLAAGKAPGNHLWRAGALVAATAAACFVGTTLLQHPAILLSADDDLGGVALLGLGMAAIIAWGYHQFRRGGIVEEGTGLIAPASAATRWLGSLKGRR